MLLSKYEKSIEDKPAFNRTSVHALLAAIGLTLQEFEKSHDVRQYIANVLLRNAKEHLDRHPDWPSYEKEDFRFPCKTLGDMLTSPGLKLFGTPEGNGH